MKSKLHVAVRRVILDSFLKHDVKEEFFVKHDGAKLFFDFYIQSLNLYIEVDGEQHSKFIPFFHRTRHGYARHVIRDGKKESYVLEKKARLLRIDSSIDPKILSKETLYKMAFEKGGNDNE